MLPKTRRWGQCRKLKIIAVFALAISLLIISAYPQNDHESTTQERRGRLQPELESKKSQESAKRDSGFKIGVSVDLVLIYASVSDAAGHFMSGLKKERFKLFEDGIGQEIQSFSQEDVPVSLGLLLDLSGSMRIKHPQVIKAARAFVQASNSQDQIFAIGFSDEVDLIQDYTDDVDEITDAIDNTAPTGGTALYDAIYLGVQKAQTGIKPKKAVIVISDGQDADSYYSIDELVSKVKELDVQVFCIGILDEKPKKTLFRSWKNSDIGKSYEALQYISEETGGKAFFPEQAEELPGIVTEIASELRNQYSISYMSSNTARDGAYRRIRIVFADKDENTHLRYRRGYYAPKADAAKK
jgi:Ca-activated chloride channel homolog